MARSPSRIQIAKDDIVRFFEASPRKIFRRDELTRILEENRAFWRLTQRVTVGPFTEFLLEKSKLRAIEIGDLIRYSWGEPSTYELALSLARGSYLCHGTALFLHHLTNQIPKVIYVNREQTPKPRPSGPLSQEGIDRAFARPQRTSKHTLAYQSVRIVLLSGKHSGRLEVATIEGPDGEHLQCTKIERTLIDVTVRPAYAGGIFQVLQAYREAQTRVSTNVLTATLKKLKYVYPYHQAVGFLMEKAGYDQAALRRLKSLGLDFDFYLVHGARQTRYDSSWRIHYPAGLESSNEIESEVEIEVERP